MKKIFLLLLTFFMAVPFFSTSIRIINWNVQTFFDAKTEGTEYSSFIKTKNWNESAYETRLDRLCSMIKTTNADVYVFEEIENLAVVQDIVNRLANHGWNGRKSFKYALFYKNPGDSIGCAVFSRYEIKDTTIHNIDIQTERKSQPKMRAIIKLSLIKDNKELVIFVNHWKSKAGGAEESEVWRNWQEKNLCRLIKKSYDKGKACIATGDFNRDISEFYKQTEKMHSLTKNNIFPDTPERFEHFEPPVQNPWLDYEEELGSYYYKNNWERIDHFFATKNATLTDFSPLIGDWTTDEYIPDSYKIYNGYGYSDHLPIECIVEF